MNARAESGSSAADTAKLLLAVALFLGGVIAFYYFEEVSTLLRVLGMVGVSAACVGIAATSAQGRGTISFAKEARQELRKVVWPTRQEALQTSLIVIVMVILVGILLWLLDMFFVWGIEKLLGFGG